MKKFEKLFNNIIKEADDSPEGTESLDENFEETEVDKPDIVLKFTNNLAAEFVQSMNELSKIGSKMVNDRDVDKDTLDKFKDLHSKIKNLLDASENSK